MSSSDVSLGAEPVAIIAAVAAVLQALQTVAISGISTGAHAVIAVVLVGLGAVLARAKVTPTARLNSAAK